MDYDLIAKLQEDILRIVQNGSREGFERDGQVDPTAFVVATKDPETHSALPEPTFLIVPLRTDDEETKAESLERLARIAQGVDALVVCTVTEAWLAEFTPSELEQIGTPAYVPPRQHPKRQEVVMLHLESSLGSQLWTAQITRPKTGPAMLGPWESTPTTALSGRMTGFLKGPLGSA